MNYKLANRQVQIASREAQSNSIQLNPAQRYFVTEDISRLMMKVMQRGTQ